MSPPHSLAYEQVLAFYPPVWPKSAENVRSLGRISSDRMLCGARRRLAWLQRAPNSTGKAFLYRFDYFYRNWPPFEPATLRSPHHEITMRYIPANPMFAPRPAVCVGRLQPALHRRAQLPRAQPRRRARGRSYLRHGVSRKQ